MSASRADAGNMDCGIFVAPSGSDAPGAGLISADPCQTINFGIQRAVEEGASCVFVQAGTYNEIVELASGVSIDGGYDAAWVRDLYTEREHAVIIVGGQHVGTGNFMTIYANNLSAVTQVRNVVIVGPNVSSSLPGRSSYAVYANNSNHVLIHACQIDAGNGSDGADGTDGADAASLVALAGMHGANGQFGGTAVSCNDSSFGNGGARGVNSMCTTNTAGGLGGNGGRADTDCGFPPDNDATPGFPGQNAQNFSPPFGDGGNPGGPCQNGQDGTNGRIINGSPGVAAAPGTGFVAGGIWQANSGTGGTSGAAGGGGGGGGGAGGCDTGTDNYGAGGGGGGAGGCPGTAGGAGTGGGGSFGVFAINSEVQVDDTMINRGNGGNGGAGGNGGTGQQGGNGGMGGSMPNGGAGGDGGRGGHGGHGGGGAGGAGGISAAIYCSNSNIATNPGLIINGGAPGSGGPGGIAGPSAAPSDDDGNDGPNGTIGMLLEVVGCGAGIPESFVECDPEPCLGGPCVGDCPGACCINGVAVTLLESECDAVSGTYMGAGTTPGRVKCPAACIADIVDNVTFLPPPDGTVDGADLAYLLSHWGPCR